MFNIFYIYNILFYPYFISFIPYIYISFNNNDFLKNVIPNENISFNSGLNYPIPFPFLIYINSGDI